jgi:hypothetical protein
MKRYLKPHLHSNVHILLANHWHAQGIKVDFVLMRRRGDLIGLLPDGIGIK